MVGHVLSRYETLHGRTQPNLLAPFASFQSLKPDNPVHIMGYKQHQIIVIDPKFQNVKYRQVDLHVLNAGLQVFETFHPLQNMNP